MPHAPRTGVRLQLDRVATNVIAAHARNAWAIALNQSENRPKKQYWRLKIAKQLKPRGAMLGTKSRRECWGCLVSVWFGAVTRANAARAVVCADRNGAGRGHHRSQS